MTKTEGHGGGTSRVKGLDVSEVFEDAGIDPRCVSDYKLNREDEELWVIVQKTPTDAKRKRRGIRR